MMSTLKATTKWESGLTFQSTVRDHQFYVDAMPLLGGQNKGPNPKELVLVGIMNCSSMDVAALLKKFREPVTGIEVTGEAVKTNTTPAVFERVDLVYSVTGSSEMKKEQVNKAVELSMTRYCGVSAMIAKTCPIYYKVMLNGEEIGQGQAQFT